MFASNGSEIVHKCPTPVWLMGDSHAAPPAGRWPLATIVRSATYEVPTSATLLVGDLSRPLALIGAAAVLVQIPYSLDEILATLQFVRRRFRAGQNVLAVLLLGDGDEAPAADRTQVAKDEFDRAPGAVLRDVISSGVSLPWNLALSAAIGVWLMCTRMTLGTAGAMANADHLIGALVLTVVSVSAAEVARPVRYLNALLGAALLATPFLYGAPVLSGALSAAAGLALILLSLRRGPVRERYAGWSRFIFGLVVVEVSTLPAGHLLWVSRTRRARTTLSPPQRPCASKHRRCIGELTRVRL